MKKNKNMLDGMIILLLLTPLGLPMVPLGTTNGTIVTNVSTNGNIGTIGYQEKFRVLWLPMVPLATNGTIGKISNVTIGRIPNARDTIGSQWYHWLTIGTNGTIGSANGTIGITIGTNGITNRTIGRTLNDIGLPLVPSVEPWTHALSGNESFRPSGEFNNASARYTDSLLYTFRIKVGTGKTGGPYNYQKAPYTGKHLELPKSTEKTICKMDSVCPMDLYIMHVG